ncbi:PspC domain-containing protein [Penaeicola halotolerans]|uniref:PspC domain-containing protein n=1 Tax=Penaeicola halotolerans TaxID=2793196 RepID=UPI001CF8CB41|nr:PspC family transcriptional regulator [Penaeicola halotolerans]
MEKIKLFFEERAFGVCTKLGEKLRMPIDHIRLFFIYTSFLALGSPLIIYLALAFVIDMRKYFRSKRRMWFS